MAFDFSRLWDVADRSRRRGRLAPDDVAFVRSAAPAGLAPFPDVKLPSRARHPAGFSMSGASAGTFVRGALLVSGQKALGRRFGGAEFYERVERDLAFRQWRFARPVDPRMAAWALGDEVVP